MAIIVLLECLRFSIHCLICNRSAHSTPASTMRQRKAKLRAPSPPPPPKMPTQRAEWLIYAVTSGACAAFNGMFAKLCESHLAPLASLANH